MKEVVIIGGGIAGLTCGIYLQKAGFQTRIHEKNSIAGGQCTGWVRDGFVIDNCIHWLTGTREGTELNKLWREIGALGDEVELIRPDTFYSASDSSGQVTFWRDLERTRKEMLTLSPVDEKEINKLIDCTRLAEGMSVPVGKPFDMMNILDYYKLGMEMSSIVKVMKIYKGMDIEGLAASFQHPLIRSALTSYMPKAYQAFAFLVSYATFTGGNGDIPRGGSIAMSERITDRYIKVGGSMYTNSAVEEILHHGNKAEGVRLANQTTVSADYVVCACDLEYTFSHLLENQYMPTSLRTEYTKRTQYPVISGLQIAFAADECVQELKGMHLFECEPLKLATETVNRMSVKSYDYEPDFAPEGKCVLQTNFSQTEADYEYWFRLNQDKKSYRIRKQQLADEVLKRLIKEYPLLNGKIKILDVWTPVTYNRYCNAYQGAYMSFIITKGAKNIRVKGTVKGLNNVMLASQWLMGPGGLPTAAAMSKFAAQRIMKRYS